MKLKNLILVLFFIFYILDSNAQTEKRDYIFIAFDQSQEEYYSKKIENGQVVKEKTFIKDELANGKVQFFINGTLFVHDPSEMEGDSLKSQLKPGTKVLGPEETVCHISKVKEIYPLGPKFPSDKFPKLVIVDTSSGEQLLYEVKWQPFQE